jgi:hypothetical protein
MINDDDAPDEWDWSSTTVVVLIVVVILALTFEIWIPYFGGAR